MKRPRRLAQIQRLLYRNPDGLTCRELSELCGVHVRTIQRDLLDLQADFGIPLTQQSDGYAILGGYALPPVSFSFYEAIALFLACRLAMRQSDKSNLHMGRALVKMAAVLPTPLAEYLKQNVGADTPGERKSDRSGIFESLAMAWMKQRQVRIRNISLQDNLEKEWLFEPYFMEMSGVGHSIYVIGRARRDELERLLSVKLDHITSAEVLFTAFERPSQSEIEALLSRTWDMMWEEETEVRLWFSRHASLFDQSSCCSCEAGTSGPDDGYMMTLHVSGWLQAHPSAVKRGGQIELLSHGSVEKHFHDYARRLWQTSRILQQERAKRQKHRITQTVGGQTLT